MYILRQRVHLWPPQFRIRLTGTPSPSENVQASPFSVLVLLASQLMISVGHLDTASNLILYSMLANTATSAGRLTLSKQFAEVARECAGLTFDRTELSCAVGLTLLGLYYLTTDQMERASYYSSLAGTMISHLQKQQKGDQSHYLAHLLLVNGIANAEAMPITEIEAQERKFLEVCLSHVLRTHPSLTPATS
jgi:hypothetical protein